MAGTAIRILEDPNSVAIAGARLFTTCARRTIGDRGRFTVALPGGSTPTLLFRRLACDPPEARFAWDRVEFFWGDERCVPPDHPESNYRAADEHLLSRIPAPPANVHRIPGELPPDEAAARYEQDLRAALRPKPDAWPRFDLVLLGLGADGHTASLFPGSAALAERARLVVASRVEALASYRITLTFPVLNAARHVAFLVVGPAKASALREALEGDDSIARCPARGVRPLDGTLEWIVDRGAAGMLSHW